MSRFKTTTGVAEKVYKAFMKNAIKFGEPEQYSTDTKEGTVWTSNKLDTGAVVKFERSLKVNGKNPRHEITIELNKNKQTVSGMYARKLYDRLINERKRKSFELTEDSAKFCEDALNGL